MRIGLYGMPCAGKTTLMGQVSEIPCLSGGQLLHELDPDFDRRSRQEQEALRKRLVTQAARNHGSFLMDGHYAFGEETVFTREDGQTYDCILYLYTDPEILRTRMERSEKNRRFANLDLAAWQSAEIAGLRSECHRNRTDFYVLDNPEQGAFPDLTEPLAFLRDILAGFSCVRFARTCADRILASGPDTHLILTDGDRTLTVEDTSHAAFGYTTCIYDGNFYTGYQTWRQAGDFRAFSCPAEIPVHWNERILARLSGTVWVLTSGFPPLWARLCRERNLPVCSGPEMCADTKYFITVFLQEAGLRVTAYGDSRMDYDMLKQAEEGYLVRFPEGRLSRSLKNLDLGGLTIV